jgi:hypothetical protein
MKCIDVMIFRGSETRADDDASVFVTRMAKMRESAFFAIMPLAYLVENVGQTGLTDAYLEGPHGALRVPIGGSARLSQPPGPMLGQPMMGLARILRQFMSVSEHSG